MRAGVFGGTFDPPHIGHLIAAQEALETLRLDCVWFIPAAMPPHKRDRQVTPAPLRVAMLQAAVAGDARFEVDPLELERPGPSYTADTLRALRNRQPEAELFLLLGSDQVRDLPTWREPEVVSQLAHIALLTREGATDLKHEGTTVRIRIDVSGTEIRRRVAERRSIRYLVPDAVEAIIETHGLYRRHPETGLPAAGTNGSPGD